MLSIGIMFYLPTIMNKQEQHHEWHVELYIICNTLISFDKQKKKRLANGVSTDDASPNIMGMFRQHFAKVAVKQNSEMDAILGYEDMVDYAKWYVSGETII
jgi:hypothetical protein